MSNKTLYSLTALFLFWTSICIWLGVEQGRQQAIDNRVKCVAVYQEDAK